MKIINLNMKRNLLLILIFFSYIILGSCSNITVRKPSGTESFNKSNKVNFTIKGSGMDSTKLAEIPGLMQQFINSKDVAGIVTLVQHNGQITSLEAVGFQNIEKNIPMRRNTIFRICSMSKPFAAVAIMMLAEEGKLQLDDPVEKYLPEFNNMWLKSQMTDEKVTLIRPVQKITIRDILRHTSGIQNELPQDFPINSIAEFVLTISQQPLEFDPGSKWSYGNSNMATAARLVEVISGKPYDVFLSARIFEPLGMKDTYFSPPEGSLERIANVYRQSADSSLEIGRIPDWYIFPHPKGGLRNYPRAEGGILSTAEDHAKWLQTMLNKGIYNGTRILKEKSVIEMTKIQTGEFETGFTEGMSYGLGFGIVRDPTGVTAMLSPGTFGHGGLYGTQGWADPKTNTIYIVMIQHQGIHGGDAHKIRHLFQKIVSAAIIN